MADDTKQCPVCAETIKAEAKVCRFCGAQFEVTRRGYCSTDHDTVDVNEDGKCKKCGNPVIDVHTETHLIPESKPAAALSGETAEWVIEPIRGEGVNWRFNGVFTDYMLIAAIFAALVWLMTGGDMKGDFASILGGATIFIIPVIWFLYFFLFETLRGATPGKQASFLKVIRKDGGKIVWWQAAVRAFLSFFEYNPIGAILIWVTPLKQRIGDLIAGTLVVNTSRIHKVEFRGTAVAFEFHDYRRMEFARITEGIIHKFGLVRQVTIRGISPDGSPLTLKWNGQYQRSELERVQYEIERRNNLRFLEKVILWRLIIVIVTLLLGFLAIAATLIWAFNQ